jgi:lipopolysaccharide/colanic/teichoic acid biosynthesis glycosyltransferase
MISPTDSLAREPILRHDSSHLPASAPTLGAGRYAPLKAALDFVLALVMFVVALPLLALLAVLVRLTSHGPSFYRQKRAGAGGRPFTMYKLRTMEHNCERRSGPQWSTPGDPRVTRLGRLLRRTHLDELPQLWNVLKGDMSLIGPRPERPEFLPLLEKNVPHYRRRLLVRPGVTGLAQVQLPPDTDVESVRRKLAYDVYYIHRMGLWLDLRILAATAFKVVGVPFAACGKLCLMPREAAVEAVYQSLNTVEPHALHLQTA